jgi:hypothetical protein
MTFCGPARDTVLTNQQVEKLNSADTNYITIVIVSRYSHQEILQNNYQLRKTKDDQQKIPPRPLVMMNGTS